MHAQAKLRITLALALLLAATHPSLAQSNAERALFQMTNQARTQHNLPPLHWDPTLAQAALAHAQWVVHEPNDLQHQYPGEPDLPSRAAQAHAHFTSVSENLARGNVSPADLHRGWMASPTHRANILDPNLNAVGIAVLEYRGFLYAVEDFSRTATVQSFDSLEKRVSQILLEHGVAPAASNADAHQTCTMQSGTAGYPRLVVQWDGPDPTLLPDALLHAIATGRYTTAEVAVCASKQPQFTTYNVAVLLY
jgi:hypothetical protein